MSCRRINYQLTAVAVVAITMTACAPAMVKDIAANKSGYLAENFTSKQLPEDVIKYIGKGSQASMGFKTITMKINAVFEDVKKNKETPSIILTLNNAGSGFVQEMGVYSYNDITFGIKYALSYGGLVNLRDQSVYYSRRTADHIVEAKQITQFSDDATKPNEDSLYSYEWSYGITSQLANIKGMKMDCRTGRFYEASMVLGTIPGKAIDFNCERFINGVTKSKQRYAFFQNYGLAVLLEHHEASTKEVYSIASVEVQ